MSKSKRKSAPQGAKLVHEGKPARLPARAAPLTRANNGLDGFEFLTPAEAITWAAFGGDAARSLLFGSCCGLLYLRLLARSVARLGPDSRSLGRVQLLVPALLVIASARIPALHLLPAFLGFVLYKPALLLQAFLAP